MATDQFMRGVADTSRAMDHAEGAIQHLDAAVGAMDGSESRAVLHMARAIGELANGVSALAVVTAQLHDDINALAAEAQGVPPGGSA